MKNGLKILLWADGLAGLAVGMIGPIYAIFVQDIGGDILDASWAYAAYMITGGVVMYLISRLQDQSQRKEKFVVAGYALTSLGCLLYVFVDSQFTLLLTQVVLGLAIAVLAPAFDALYSHFVHAAREASNWGMWEGLSYVVTGIGAIAGGYIVNLYGFKTLFVVMFAVSLLGTIASAFIYKDQEFLHSHSS